MLNLAQSRSYKPAQLMTHCCMRSSFVVLWQLALALGLAAERPNPCASEFAGTVRVLFLRVSSTRGGASGLLLPQGPA
jgi:hypothetical protein